MHPGRPVCGVLGAEDARVAASTGKPMLVSWRQSRTGMHETSADLQRISLEKAESNPMWGQGRSRGREEVDEDRDDVRSFGGPALAVLGEVWQPDQPRLVGQELKLLLIHEVGWSPIMGPTVGWSQDSWLVAN